MADESPAKAARQRTDDRPWTIDDRFAPPPQSIVNSPSSIAGEPREPHPSSASPANPIHRPSSDERSGSRLSSASAASPGKLLALVTDAFGGRGGIAKFNRDMLTALCAYPGCDEVIALPRLVVETPGPLPENLRFIRKAAGSKAGYLHASIRHVFSEDKINGVICGHINLLPLAYAAARRKSVPLVLVIHGIDAWQPTSRRLVNALAGKIDAFVAVSDFTKGKFIAWTGLPSERGYVIPNCIDSAEYGPGPKPAYLLQRYVLAGRTVMLTLGRLSAAERYKGHDEVLEVMPELAREQPDLSYLIVGDGDDRPRLERKAAQLGLQDRVVFAGYVPEEEKADHYRLADAFVMPGRGEGFGIAYLEALACGLPVVASSADASREAVRNGLLGEVADPDDPASITKSIRTALAQKGRTVPPGLDFFSFPRFQQRWHHALDERSMATAQPA